MRSYETMVIVDALVADDAIETELSKIQSRIENHGEIVKIDHWGKRKMAYDIRKKSHGYYAVFYYTADNTVIEDLDKDFRINENILRWVTIKDQPIPADKVEATEAAAQGEE